MILLNIDPIQVYDEAAHYIDCDFCNQTACDDIWAGNLHEEDWRFFYLIVGEGVHVCEHCLTELEVQP